ncbi:hypothetical protein Poli38472_012333 [Pythium oligandrum]|uniref:Uncharacterized protein n=1 Tax=Pythium oligandrum TaxID=41045 RepID=A0A8K1FPS8_PYTOL|nr:hypothetical protein Poli38472_012333 [Pythium oligandrum]|eukprot:TMW67217.1 hypothetical protein Poli38472_012333 [Pythium oligandrum]
MKSSEARVNGDESTTSAARGVAAWMLDVQRGRPLPKTTGTRSGETKRPLDDDGSAQALLALLQSGGGMARESGWEEPSGRSDQERSDDPEGTHPNSAKPKKKRKSTHTVRKEEKAVLLENIRNLEAQLEFLRSQVITPTDTPAPLTNVVPPTASNTYLRDMIVEQQLCFAASRSILSQTLATDLPVPLQLFVHLGMLPADRRRTLTALKPKQLRLARRYIIERSRFMNLLRPHAATEYSVSTRGDTVCVRFFIDQFPGHDVLDIHDAVSYYTSNVEFTVGELNNNITIREDDESINEPGLSQHRLVTTADNGLVIDTNNVFFSQYDADERCGISVARFVDQDDLHPYRPHERLRHDIVAILLVTMEQSQVVVRRWVYVRHCRSDYIRVSEDVLMGFRERIGQWGDTMIHFIRRHVASRQNTDQKS